jgi:hypothetical protein
MNFERRKLLLVGNDKAQSASNGMSADRAALTVFSEHETGCKPHSVEKTMARADH